MKTIIYKDTHKFWMNATFRKPLQIIANNIYMPQIHDLPYALYWTKLSYVEFYAWVKTIIKLFEWIVISIKNFRKIWDARV
jgi:hypothetical protein